MEAWRKNLMVCWFAVFVVSSGMSQMAPMLPLYIEHLGVHDPAAIARWSGIVFGSNFISLAIFSPIWGKFSDKYGRKSMMMRASLWLSIIMTCMGFAQDVYQLAGLRIMQGALSGFQSTAITLVATQTPKARAGWALGVLFSGQVGGSLLGPLFGGYLAETFGYREDFLIVGSLCFVAFLATALLIKEQRGAINQASLTFREVWQALPNPQITVCLFITTLVLQLALMSIQPIITVYITQISSTTEHVALVSGAVFAASGLASILAAPKLGKLSDRIGAQKVLFVALIFAGITFLPQALVTSPLELGFWRFLLGLATAGLLPSINSLIRQSTPDRVAGRAYGYNQSAQFFGMFTGSILGGQMAALVGIRYVLYFTGALLLLNSIWVYKTISRRKFIGSSRTQGKS